MTIIDINQLRFRYPKSSHDILAIDHFTVGRGERLFIKGESGCGKSTLLGLLGGVSTAQSGSVSVLDTDIAKLKGAKRDHFRANHIGFIFQMFNLIPYLSTIENVILPCRFSKQRRQRASANHDLAQEALRLLTHLGLEDPTLLARPVTELSMGQQQRVAAARALIGSPELIIADEPTSSLDADARGSFLKLLFDECQVAGTTLVFVSHDASLYDLFNRTVALSDINHVPQVGR